MIVPGGGCGHEYWVQSCIENVIRTATETGGSGDTGTSCITQHHIQLPLHCTASVKHQHTKVILTVHM